MLATLAALTALLPVSLEHVTSARVVISRGTCLCGLPYAKVATTTVYASLHRIAVSARVRRIRSGSETQTGVSSWFAGSKNVADTEYEAKKARAAATEAVRSQTP